MTYAGEALLAALWRLGRGSVSNPGIRSGADGGADGKTWVVLVGVDAERRAHRTALHTQASLRAG